MCICSFTYFFRNWDPAGHAQESFKSAPAREVKRESPGESLSAFGKKSQKQVFGRLCESKIS